MFASVCQCLPMFANVCQCLKMVANVCQCLPMFANVCQCLPMVANVCQCLPIFANVANLYYNNCHIQLVLAYKNMLIVFTSTVNTSLHTGWKSIEVFAKIPRGSRVSGKIALHFY